MSHEYIKFLTLDEVLIIHKDQINRYGGSLGIRDEDLLKSALAQPMVTFGSEYLHNSIYSMAAAYLFHLIQNHPFVDGNKRVGFVSSLVFLDKNSYDFIVCEDLLLEVIFLVASSKKTKSELTIFFQKHALKGKD